MKDSVHFNIDFIAEVKKHRELYDYTLAGYSNRSVTQAIWSEIGEKFNETGDDCRSKWKSIRSAYIRSFNNKSTSGRSKRQYYMASSLQFLNPFTHKGKTEHTNEENDSETEELIIDHATETQPKFVIVKHEDQTCQSPVDSASRSSNDSPPLKRIKKNGDPFSDYTPKRRRQENRTLDPRKDACEMFLLSLVPHMATMTQPQQLSFQKRTLELIENIKYVQTQG